MEPPPPHAFVSKRPVKFVASDEDGLPLKRRQVQQACDSCRRKKKRCPHGAGSTGYSFTIQDGPAQRPAWTRQPRPQPPNTSHPGRLPISPESSEQNDEASSTALVASQLVELSTSRFVGDLSPESVFIEATNTHSPDSRLHRNRSEVGTWMRDAPRPNMDQDDVAGPGRGDDTAQAVHPPHNRAKSLLTLGGRLAEQQDPDVAKSHLIICPPDQDYQCLCDIYVEQIHPILPILKETEILTTKGSHKLSPRQNLLKQVISLAAAVDPSASKCLRLEVNGPLLLPQSFHQRLSKAIFASVDANVLVDTVDRIRVLLIMSLFYQPRLASERDILPLIFSQATHHAQSIGLHLRAAGRSSEEEDAEGLYCILWALDRMNAAFHGRPCLLHQRDTDRELDECIAKQELPGFRLFLGVVKMLDRVICLYRPHHDGVESVEVPIFESMIIDAGAEKLPPRILSTIEIFYHGVSVLSCRESAAITAAMAPSSAHLPHPTINARRSLSADRVVDSVGSSLTYPSSLDSVFIMPFVPYAVALSLSVVYLKMRHSKIPMYRSRAKHRFHEIVTLLQRMGELHTSARVNAALGVAILREMDKAAKELASVSVAQDAGAGPVPAREPRSHEQEVSPGHSSAHIAADSQRQDATPLPRQSGPPGTAMDTPRMSSAAREQSGARQNSTPRPAVAQGTASTPQAATAPHVALSTPWEDISDIDLFVHFDPGFDLSAVDAALGANLDMGYPQLWTTTPWPE